VSSGDTRVGRLVRLTARQAQGDGLAAKLLEAATLLEDAPGCELYVISQGVESPDVVWVWEVWETRADLERSLALARAGGGVDEVLALLDGPPERTDVRPLGGPGLPPVGGEPGGAFA
jgi:quinol monooxygenase YgiN